MSDLNTIRKHLRAFDFKSLLVEELGWDFHKGAPVAISVDGIVYTLRSIAEKRGMVVYEGLPGEDGEIPPYPIRRKIDLQLAKIHYEHIIIFTNSARSTQIWQWVKRGADMRPMFRSHIFRVGEKEEGLPQKLDGLRFSIDEEDEIDLFGVTSRAKQQFDVDKITKRFYDRFKKEHDVFLKFIDGIPNKDNREWYASLMLNRMMFIYFIQKRGFLDGDRHYLRNRLKMMQEKGGKDRFLRFYRLFLLRLFHEGLGKPEAERAPDLAGLLGKVPYLNGGLFDEHELERENPNIQIPDKAFELIFAFFDSYDWHLDDRPMRSEKEINPDVLGYIFEKYINQKQMGAYYTKEDITGYISRNTIIPFLFDAARKECPIAFESSVGVRGEGRAGVPPAKKGSAGLPLAKGRAGVSPAKEDNMRGHGERGDNAATVTATQTGVPPALPYGTGGTPVLPFVWQLLRSDPDRYIYEAVRRGVDVPLPAEIAAGVDDVSKRGGWNRPAAPEYALPTETWREHVARRKRCEEIRAKLRAGEVTSINDLITYNLDIEKFAQDVIINSEGPELVKAFWNAIEKISVLDPTCGSGAFLFAALNVLEPLYNACLDGMQGFLDDLERSWRKHHPDKLKRFREVLEQVKKHANRRYFVLKSIVVNNLYGVDIMEEAVEICKLRLFLKIVAQVDDLSQIEPLPDIDFNVRAGNTLVGFASISELEKTQENTIGFGKDQMTRIVEDAEIIGREFKTFRKQQTDLNGRITTDNKRVLRARLRALADELDQYLAKQYGVDSGKLKEFTKWRLLHQPFHWFAEFYEILSDKGFDVIIGNPPYVEYSAVKKQYLLKEYATIDCGNLYAYVVEQGYKILQRDGRMGMIVQLPITCTDRMRPLQKLCLGQSRRLWIASFDDRPARLFDGLEHIRATIFLSQKTKNGSKCTTFSTGYNRWYSEMRSDLFSTLANTDISDCIQNGAIPKIGSEPFKKLFQKILSKKQLVESFSSTGSYFIYFHNAPQYWIRAMDFVPYFWNERDGEQLSTQVKVISFGSKKDASAAAAALNSSLFYWWFVILSDCRHLNMREIERFPVGLKAMAEDIKSDLAQLNRKLMADLKQHAQRKECYYKTTGKVVYDEFYPRFSKPIIDEIDQVLAKHYGFTDEELDFIINYDIKYRMGADSDEEVE